MVLAIIRLPVTPPRRSLPPRTGRGALLLAVLLAATGCFLFPIPPSKNAERPNVTSFDIEGTHAISSKELSQHLATQESGRKYLVWPAPEEFDQDAFANDKRRCMLSHVLGRARVVESAAVVHRAATTVVQVLQNLRWVGRAAVEMNHPVRRQLAELLQVGIAVGELDHPLHLLGR